MARATSSNEDENRSLIHKAVATSLIPVHVAASRPAIKAYLSTILFFLASISLLAISTTAYLVFYYNYIPRVNLSRELYLQYGSGRHPHAITVLSSSGAALTSQQPYDISVELRLPRTENNVGAGNFMIDVELLSSDTHTSSIPSVSAFLPNTTSTSTVARSRRPTILPYTSRLTGLTATALSLPLHVFGVRDLDTDVLRVSMFERVSFARGWRNVPTAAKVEVQSEKSVLEVYSAKILFEARFEGLRYLIYNYRVLSWAVFSATFYGLSFASMAVAWLAVSAYIGPKVEHRIALRKGETADDHMTSHSNGYVKGELEAKREEDDESVTLSAVSDTATTFPTLGRQMPLRYPGGQPASTASSSQRIKQEGRSPIEMEPVTQPITHGHTADDEDDNEGIHVKEEDEITRGRGDDRDSGIGTSMESEHLSAGLVGLMRRRSAGSRGGGTVR